MLNIKRTQECSRSVILIVRDACNIFLLEALLLVSKGGLHSDNNKLNDILITTE